jgi:hypothetical protein
MKPDVLVSRMDYIKDKDGEIITICYNDGSVEIVFDFNFDKRIVC